MTNLFNRRLKFSHNSNSGKHTYTDSCCYLNIYTREVSDEPYGYLDLDYPNNTDFDNYNIHHSLTALINRTYSLELPSSLCNTDFDQSSSKSNDLSNSFLPIIGYYTSVFKLNYKTKDLTQLFDNLLTKVEDSAYVYAFKHKPYLLFILKTPLKEERLIVFRLDYEHNCDILYPIGHPEIIFLEIYSDINNIEIDSYYADNVLFQKAVSMNGDEIEEIKNRLTNNPKNAIQKFDLLQSPIFGIFSADNVDALFFKCEESNFDFDEILEKKSIPQNKSLLVKRLNHFLKELFRLRTLNWLMVILMVVCFMADMFLIYYLNTI